MEVELPLPVNPAMTFDEVSMERSKCFVKALQELKNLRPQLYSAAEYCEKSYLHSEQKQMVLDNLKDYAVRALVNAIDHLGTVAFKLNDLLEQQTSDISTMEVKVSCLNQQLFTCQTYMDKEGLRQHQLLAIIPRHHKHYALPNSVSKKVQFSPHIQRDARHNHLKTTTRIYPSGTPTSKTLSWHLASQTKSTLKGMPHAAVSSGDIKTSGQISGVFHLSNDEQSNVKSSAMQTFGTTRKDLEGSKNSTAFRSFNNLTHHEVIHAPARSKSMLSAFFVKQKTPKVKSIS